MVHWVILKRFSCRGSDYLEPDKTIKKKLIKFVKLNQIYIADKV